MSREARTRESNLAGERVCYDCRDKHLPKPAPSHQVPKASRFPGSPRAQRTQVFPVGGWDLAHTPGKPSSQICMGVTPRLLQVSGQMSLPSLWVHLLALRPNTAVKRRFLEPDCWVQILALPLGCYLTSCASVPSPREWDSTAASTFQHCHKT